MKKYFLQQKIILLLLIFILNWFSQLTAEPQFLNIEVLGGGAISSANPIGQLFYLYEKRGYYGNKESSHSDNVYAYGYDSINNSYFGKLFVDYGLNNYFSIYSSIGYKILYGPLPYMSRYDEYGNPIEETKYSGGEYYYQMTGLDFDIMAKARLLHYDENLNYWFALGTGLFVFKPKLKFFGPGEEDEFLLKKDAFSEDSAGVMWYLKLGTGMDIRLSERWFLLWNGYLKFYLNNIEVNYKNIDYLNVTQGNDTIKVYFKHPYEFVFYMGVGYQIFKEAVKKETKFTRDKKFGVNMELGGIGGMLGLKGVYSFLKYFSVEVGTGFLPVSTYLKEMNIYSFHITGITYFSHSNWSPYIGSGIVYFNHYSKSLNGNYYLLYLPLGIEYMSNAGAVFGFEFALRYGLQKEFLGVWFGYKFGIRI